MRMYSSVQETYTIYNKPEDNTVQQIPTCYQRSNTRNSEDSLSVKLPFIGHLCRMLCPVLTLEASGAKGYLS